MIKSLAISALKSVGLHSRFRKIKRALHANGYLPWQALVPLEAFKKTCTQAIETLRKSDHEFGDYVEFGVSRGTSMLGAYQAIKKLDQRDMRFIGFDSFEGMPKEADSEGWQEGAFASTIDATRRYLTSNGVNANNITLVKGWFSETLNDQMKGELNLKKASIIMIDCDIYSASKDALMFCNSLIHDNAVVIFDDWACQENAGEIGQKEAFAEFLDAYPDLSADPIDSYTFDDGFQNSRAFLLRREPVRSRLTNGLVQTDPVEVAHV